MASTSSLSTATPLVCHWSPPSMEAWMFAIGVHLSCWLMGYLPLGLILYFFLRQERQPTTTTTTTMLTTIPSLRPQGQQLMRQVLCVALATCAAAFPPVLVFGSSLFSVFSPEGHVQTPSYYWMGPFLLSNLGFSTFFKIINAGFGQYPEGADENLYIWLLWFISIPEPSFCKGKLRGHASWTSMGKSVTQLVWKIPVVGLLVSLIAPRDREASPSPDNYQLFSAWATTNSNSHTTMAWFSLPVPEWLVTILNGYFHLWVLYLFLAFCCDFGIVSNLATTVGRVQFELGFDSPLLASRSLREVWGQRWNNPVSKLLKRTVYIPTLRRQQQQQQQQQQEQQQQGWNSQPRTATLWTFLASGLLHEYTFSVSHGSVYFETQFGTVSLFFVIMALLMQIEDMVYHTLLPPSWQQAIQQYIPTMIISITFSVVLVAWPFERYFIPSWLLSGWVEALSELFPTYQCQSNIPTTS